MQIYGDNILPTCKRFIRSTCQATEREHVDLDSRVQLDLDLDYMQSIHKGEEITGTAAKKELPVARSRREFRFEKEKIGS